MQMRRRYNLKLTLADEATNIDWGMKGLTGHVPGDLTYWMGKFVLEVRKLNIRYNRYYSYGLLFHPKQTL